MTTNTNPVRAFALATVVLASVACGGGFEEAQQTAGEQVTAQARPSTNPFDGSHLLAEQQRMYRLPRVAPGGSFQFAETQRMNRLGADSDSSFEAAEQARMTALGPVPE